MNAHDSANVTSQISSASGRSQVFRWIQAVRVNHEVSVRQVDFGCLAPVLAVEEFRQGPLFDRVDGVIVKPSTEIPKRDDEPRAPYTVGTENAAHLYDGTMM